MGLDQSVPDQALKNFFRDRYSPNAPPPMEMDENNWSNRAFIHTFDLMPALTGGARIMKAKFDVGAPAGRSARS